jgi:hypothetical protein
MWSLSMLPLLQPNLPAPRLEGFSPRAMLQDELSEPEVGVESCIGITASCADVTLRYIFELVLSRSLDTNSGQTAGRIW